MIILDIGCGKRKTLNSIGMDIRKDSDADVIHDFTRFPYPFKNKFDVVVMNHILEHTNDYLGVLNEIKRLLKLDGRIIIRVPHCSSVNAFAELEHKTFWATQSFVHLEHRYGFKIKKLKLVYISNPNELWFYNIINSIMNQIINLNFWLTERFLCYYLGGISEIYCELEVDHDFKDDKYYVGYKDDLKEIGVN